MASALEVSGIGHSSDESAKFLHYGDFASPLNQKSKYFFSRLFNPQNSELFLSRRALKEILRVINTVIKTVFSSKDSFFAQSLIQMVNLAKQGISFLKVYKTVRICCRGPQNESWIRNAYHCSNMTQSLIVAAMTFVRTETEKAIALVAFCQLTRSSIKLIYQSIQMKGLFRSEEKTIQRLKISKTIITLANSALLLITSTFFELKSGKILFLTLDIFAVTTGVAKSFCKQIRFAS